MNTKPAARIYSAARFSFDDSPAFMGWGNGTYWNGWGCPAFERSAADAVCAEYNRVHAIDRESPFMRFCEFTRAYVETSCEGERTIHQMERIETVNGPRDVWRIGAWCACWNEELPGPDGRFPEFTSCPYCSQGQVNSLTGLCDMWGDHAEL
jgi:hypothetical protein